MEFAAHLAGDKVQRSVKLFANRQGLTPCLDSGCVRHDNGIDTLREVFAVATAR
jgi:hypothetical protein